MTMNSQTKILLLIGATVLLIFLLYKGSSSTPNQENFTAEDNMRDNNLPENIVEQIDTEYISRDEQRSMDAVSGTDSQFENNSDSKNGSMPIPQEEMIKHFPQKDYSTSTSNWFQRKVNGRDKAIPGQYKRSSYNGARRGDLGPSDWGMYFDNTNNVIGNAETGDNDKFLPIDETNSKFAVFKDNGNNRPKCGSNQDCSPEDLFDVDKYLPQEVNDDWFEVTPEPISVKNRHLINITKPVGINTIGTSLKNASWDLRGSPACPKFVVSPWLQSSIEPDTNIKPLY